MNKERLWKILEFDKENTEKIQGACWKFYENIGRQTPVVIPDIQTVAEFLFRERGYQFLHIPMKSKEIGAFQLHLNQFSYLVLNTSKSLANNNFAVAHELYHMLIQQESNRNNAELYMNQYEENENEMMANAFAGSILMPMDDFRLFSMRVQKMHAGKFERASYIRELSMVFDLMNYYKTTYMSVVIRCYEAGIFDVKADALMEFLLGCNEESQQRTFFNEISRNKGSVSIMEPTFSDDFEMLFEEAKRIGEENLKKGFITKEDFKYRLNGMRKVYESVRKK